MRRAAWIVCCVLAAGILCGCSPRVLPQSKDISNVELVRTLAIDNASEGKVKVTVSSSAKRQADSGGGGKPLILS